MPRVTWQLQNERPIVEIYLRDPLTGSLILRTLLAGTGAGHRYSKYDVILSDSDCQRFSRKRGGLVRLGGAIMGWFPIHMVWIEIPALAVARRVAAVAVLVPQMPTNLDGIAAFRFLNSFTYGNFGDANQSGLETP